MDYHKFVYDEDQIKKFHSILSPLKEHEAYFLSMSARNKYLSAEERKEIDLGRTEMFARKLVKYPDYETFIRTIHSMEVAKGGYTSRSNITLPEKCLVVYANINPVDGIKALKEFQEKTTQMLFDMVDGGDVLKSFSSLDTVLMNCYQRAKGEKKLIDVDFDIPLDGKSLLDNVIQDFHSHGVKEYVIKTKSGFHVLIEKDTLKYNYTQVINEVDKEAKKMFDKSEVVINSNSMVPVPGTIAAGHQVKFVSF